MALIAKLLIGNYPVFGKCGAEFEKLQLLRVQCFAWKLTKVAAIRARESAQVAEAAVQCHGRNGGCSCRSA
jgi:hypothetical protein